MQFKTLFLFAGLAWATPEPQAGGNIATNTHSPFRVQARRQGSAVDNTPFKAAKSSIFLNLPRSYATCDATTDGAATFEMKKGKLFLYTTKKTTQELYVVRNSMGQGKLGYLTGAQSAPKNAELDKWAVTMDGRLVFDGAGFIACPGGQDKSHSVWVNAGTKNPGGNKNCFDFAARILLDKKPVGCQYTK